MDEAFDCWQDRQEAERLSPALRRLARGGPARPGAPRPQPSLRGSLEHRQRSPRARQAGRAADRRRTRRASCAGGRHPAGDLRAATTSSPATTDSKRRRCVRLQLQAVRVWQVPRGQPGPSRCSAAKPPPASARAANISSRSAKQGGGPGRFPGELLRPLRAARGPTTPDAEFRGQDQNPFVAGEFVWTGFDYLGEPTPYNADVDQPARTSPIRPTRRGWQQELAELGKINVPSRSSYFGIIDLAGFPKDRFYLYQARWRPDLPMAHILPHWNWPDRVGQVTPVHVYTSGDEAELFLNGKSLGRKKKGPFEYRLRWDDVKYAARRTEGRGLQGRPEMGRRHRQDHRRRRRS